MKMFQRAKQDDIEGNFRRHWLLHDLLECYFKLRDMWYLGPKESFKWLKSHDNDTYQSFKRSLNNDFSLKNTRSLIDRAIGNKIEENHINFSILKLGDIDEIIDAFKTLGWNKPKSLFERYFDEQKHSSRTVFIAKHNHLFCGYVTIKWQSDYACFRNESIPEIVDLNVLPQFRKQGIGTSLIQACIEETKAKNYNQIGLGVGLIADYGNAQRLYIQLGFIPDGKGLFYRNSSVRYGDHTVADDDLVIYFKKSI